MKISRRELDVLAKEKKISRYYDYTKPDLAKKLGFEVEKVRTPNISRADLDEMAKNAGTKNTKSYSKHELAEKLGVTLPRARRKQAEIISRKCRKVKILKTGEASLTYQSINLAARALGVAPCKIYRLVEKGEAEFVNE